MIRKILFLLLAIVFLAANNASFATNYVVATKSSLIGKMTNALPGDTITISNGTYNWDAVSFANNNGTSTSPWIVLKAQTFNKVIFTGTTYLQFSGMRILIEGFRFLNGNAGENDVIQFRSSSTAFAYYSRITNITIDSYNSDSTGASNNTGTKNGGDTLNRWVSLYGTHNRVDHCSFLNKFNGSPVIVVWYDSTNYPARATSTFHLIDSNYFDRRGYLGGNEGEVIRVGTSENSRTDGYNVVEYNLFTNGVQIDPEIISNKSNFNTYRYNTFLNHAGGITLREGRYCSVYGNFFIRNNANSASTDYGIRVIDKGHKVYNNYIEALNGNNNNLTGLRCPIILYNGVTYSTDTTDPSFAARYFAADSAIIAFNTIVNCLGGAGIVLGYNADSASPYQPKGIIVANNLIKMSKGQAALIDTSIATDSVTYMAEGNIYQTPKGLGLAKTTGFTTKTLTFGTRANGILPPPSLVTDAAVNTNSYAAILAGLDAQEKIRSAIYDVGAIELNGSGNVVAFPLDTTLVGAGTPISTLPITLSSFTGSMSNAVAKLEWTVANETNFKEYQLLYGTDGIDFSAMATIPAANKAAYTYQCNVGGNQKNYFRLRMVDNDGSFVYSNTILLLSDPSALPRINVYPNPAKGFVTINTNNINAKSYIVITDYLGKVIQTIPVNNGVQRISVDGLANGMYGVELFENDKRVTTVPLLVARR